MMSYPKLYENVQINAIYVNNLRIKYYSLYELAVIQWNIS